MFDRIVSVGGWPHSIDERDIGTELPLRRVDFEAEPGVPSNPQDLTAVGLFTLHNPPYTDPSIFSSRFVFYLAASPITIPAWSTFAMPRGQNQLYKFISVSAASAKPFDDLCDGLQRGSTYGGWLPSTDTGVEDVDGTALDTDLYMAHIVPHAASITLHNPYIDFSDPHCPSANRCLRAARSIINTYYLLMSTSFDNKRLHPFVMICWYLAAVVRVQHCRHLIDIGDRQNEAAVWGEINLLRQAMIDSGTVSPIGVRQEKLLQGLMTDITRLTSRAQPLNPNIAEVVDASNKSTHNPGASSIERLHNRNSAPQPNLSHVLSHAAPLSAPTT
ncbi:hypothetical protein M407DRAFT_26134 [Tulasnella calospora MUT 4182]|uniref:Transcription factor domain-containing protein n=1 Tax=Tulasnella calospora MUT 4182 TaxID=1051891 RepID=A0A0C3KSJ3_9AGAM|nr:hypothetical protein M407DRAFT_26134 [Tulasnella calospora MUT 4182]